MIQPSSLLSQPWVFDATVAQCFDQHAEQNIPGYREVIALCMRTLLDSCSPASRIAEVGCATGYTLRALRDAGFCNLVGIDNAPEMLARCHDSGAQLVNSSTFPNALGPFSAVLVNWTLHFLPPEQRFTYLQDMVAGLVPGGTLILSEKTRQSPWVEALYHDFKRDQGMSQEEIDEKRRRLEGVLVPLPLTWYADAMQRLDLQFEILWAKYGFVTFLARKAAR